MGRGKEERKGNLVASAILGAAGLALGWAALELGTGGILTRGREAVDRSLKPKDDRPVLVVEDDRPVLLVKERDTRTTTQIEEDEIIQALNEGSEHTRKDKERGTSKWRS